MFGALLLDAIATCTRSNNNRLFGLSARRVCRVLAFGGDAGDGGDGGCSVRVVAAGGSVRRIGGAPLFWGAMAERDNKTRYLFGFTASVRRRSSAAGLQRLSPPMTLQCRKLKMQMPLHPIGRFSRATRLCASCRVCAARGEKYNSHDATDCSRDQASRPHV